METRKITELIKAEYNPRRISEHMLQKLQDSIREFGFVEPIIINKDNTIIGGHQRVAAAENLGLTEVPVIVVDLTKDQEKKLNLALNKIVGEFNPEKLVVLLNELDDISLTGFTESELQYFNDTITFNPDGGNNSPSGSENGSDAELPQGEISEGNFKLTFYIESETIFNQLHEFFGGKADHDLEKLLSCVTLYQEKEEKLNENKQG
ncbi:MAG TPA: ParB N-terminal domain-containing protein [Candidatus Cloacimonas sp.]|nr:ParB N-terminal domain-containing protein [Candidatus Cloacimonas sp.]HPS60778.1 ParB N-terminal domain-containing protein [Candidatus Cloacimonas sp.]